MLHLVRIALTKPYTFVVLAVLILIVGPLAALRTPVDIFPEIRIPVIAVVWGYTGVGIVKVFFHPDIDQHRQRAGHGDRPDRAEADAAQHHAASELQCLDGADHPDRACQAGLRVAVLDGNDKVTLMRVTIARDLGRMVEIGSGLAHDDRVIESPPDGLTDGDPVRVVVPAGKK